MKWTPSTSWSVLPLFFHCHWHFEARNNHTKNRLIEHLNDQKIKFVHIHETWSHLYLTLPKYKLVRNCVNSAIFLSVMEMNLPVVVDQSLGGGFSYYPACRQRCIQCCHYSILIYYRPNFGARPGQAILGSPQWVRQESLKRHCYMEATGLRCNHRLC